jgi:DNA-binding SARP family transcriptional activator/tetratricopeptide (TPR) repeat protein
VEFRLLGSLEVIIDGASVDVGGTQPRTVLAMLLVSGGRMVPAESIIEALWGHKPPDSAAGTLQSYVSRLRRVLVPGGTRGEAAKVLAWNPPGYKLVVGAKALDAHRFEALADQGRGVLVGGDPEGARAVLDDALALWRGPALLEFAHLDFAWGFAAKLEERRLVATEDRIDADLRLGRHAAVVGELGELVAAHPLREQLRHHLALALYRSGRQAEALRVLDDARRTLRDQLGIDPGRPLVDLETAILNHDPTLELAGDVSTAVPPAAAGSGADPVAPPRPAALPGNGSAPALPAAEAVTATSGAASSWAPGLVGRDVELRQVMLALDEAGTATRVVLVEGEPGIGKTRLVEEAATAAAARGAAVLWGRAFEGGAAPAFWPWLPPLRSLVGRLDRDTELAPQLASLAVATSSADAAGADAALVTDRTRFELFDAVTGLIAQSSGEQQLMLVLDDLQWADPASLQLLTFVAGQLVDRPVLLVGTVRQLEVGRNDGVVEALAALSRAPGTRRIFLRGLSDMATAELVEVASGRPVDSHVAAAIQERAEGNPFFATELARLVVAERGGAGAVGAASPGGDVPSGVRDVVRRRIALLPEATVAMLQVAAVIGRDIELDLLTAASGDPIDTVLDAIEPAVVHRLLAPVPERPATFRFSHALVREVVADDVSALRRARIHLSVANALESTAGDLDDAAEILAEHLWAAAAIGVGQRAAEALERAATVAVRRYAFEAAEGMLERAVQLRRTAGTTPLDIEAEVVAASRLLSIQRSVHGYASIADSPHLRRAKELAQRAGRADIHARLLWAEWAAYDTRCDFDRSDAIAQQLHELGGQGDGPLARITGLASLGISRWHRGHVGEASALLDDACRAAEEAAVPTATLGLDLEVMLLPYPFARYLHVLTGDLDEPAGEAEFQALAAAAPDRYAVSLVQMFASAGAVTTGRPEWAERAARRGIDADPDGTFSFWGRGLHGYLAAALILQDRVDEGLSMIDVAIDRFIEAGGRTGVVVYRAARAAGLAAAGRIDAAVDAVAAAYRELETYGERFAEPLVLEADASMRHARGDEPAEVAGVLAAAIALAAEQGSHGIARRLTATAQRLGVSTD